MELEAGLCFGGMLEGEIEMSAFPFALVKGDDSFQTIDAKMEPHLPQSTWNVTFPHPKSHKSLHALMNNRLYVNYPK